MTNRDCVFLITCLVWVVANLGVCLLFGSDAMFWSEFGVLAVFGVIIVADRKSVRFNRWLNSKVGK
jgi:hypothetical protein